MSAAHKKYKLEGAAFERLEALCQKFLDARDATKKKVEEMEELEQAAHAAMWAAVPELCPAIDLGQDGIYRINREHHDAGVIFVEPTERCDCPVHSLQATPGDLAGLFRRMFGGATPDEDDVPIGTKH